MLQDMSKGLHAANKTYIEVLEQMDLGLKVIV